VRELDIGLAASGEALADNRYAVTLTTRRFAQSISFDVPGFEPDDMGFHLAPGSSKRVILRPLITKPLRGTAIALNAEATARILP